MSVSSDKEMEIEKSTSSLLICITCEVSEGPYVLHFITWLSALRDDLRKAEEEAVKGDTDQTQR